MKYMYLITHHGIQTLIEINLEGFLYSFGFFYFNDLKINNLSDCGCELRCIIFGGGFMMG